jgi:hypothetical protein
MEYSDARNIVHILVWGPVPFLGEGVPTAELLSAVKAANGVAVLAHPSRRDAWKEFNPAWRENLLGIEAWNRKTDGWAPGRNSPLLLSATGILPFVGMDFHDQNQFFPMSMELNMSGRVNEQAVLDCLRSLECHARVFGCPAEQVTKGLNGIALEIAEYCRRNAAKTFRSFKRKRRRRPEGGTQPYSDAGSANGRTSFIAVEEPGDLPRIVTWAKTARNWSKHADVRRD